MAQLKRHCNYYYFHDSNAAFIRIFKGKLNLEEKPEHQLSRHILPQIYDKSLNSA